jgi:putative NIF3 family GTP cyclohydrolase 1 type 2
MHFLERLFDRKKPARVRDVLQLLKTIPEYQDAMVNGTGPNLIAGKENNKTGRIFVDMTGGTEGSKKVFARLSQVGVGTIVAMHLSEEHFKKAKAEFINVIIAGHIASDTLGLNLILDELTKRYNFNIIPCSGFARVKR